ncbi:MAG: T9SS type A sorting domain-containing protein [Ferruginibacter sp.]
MSRLIFTSLKLLTFLLISFICCSNAHAQSQSMLTAPTGEYYSVEDASDVDRKAVVISKHFSDGTLDLSYGTNGYSDIVIINYSGGVLLNNGKLLLIGSTNGAYFQDIHYHIVYARINPDGKLDPTFGNGGIVINNQNSPYYEFVRSIGFTHTGEIIITIDEVHLLGIGGKSIDVFILNAQDGQMIGQALVPIPINPFTNDFDDYFSQGTFVYTDNRLIFTLGHPDDLACAISPQACTGFDFFTLVFNSDGSRAFNGIDLITDFGMSADYSYTAAFVNNKLIVGGTSNSNMGNPSDFAVARYNADGSLDAGFNGTGKLTIPFGVNTSVKSIVDQNGKIILGGNDATHTYLARLNDDGSLDNSFAMQGKVIVDLQVNWDYLFIDGNRLMGGFDDKSPAVFIYLLDAPTITFNCPANTTVNTDPGKCLAIVNNIDPVFSATGNNSLVNYSLAGASMGTGSGSASGISFNKGITTVTYILKTDPAVTCSFNVAVQDKEPPVITNAAANPASLWPPNHQMKEVEINYTLTDNCQATAVLSVSSNEPQDPAGDWQIIDAHHIKLRADRANNGNGRLYTITIIATDAAGNKTTKQVFVKVPHDQAAPKLIVKVYPNPTTNYFTFTSPTPNFERVNIRIYDQFGKLVETFYRVLLSGGVKVGANYSPGIYIAEVDFLNDKFLLIKKPTGSAF